jgi:hypothetical protein
VRACVRACVHVGRTGVPGHSRTEEHSLLYPSGFVMPHPGEDQRKEPPDPAWASSVEIDYLFGTYVGETQVFAILFRESLWTLKTGEDITLGWAVKHFLKLPILELNSRGLSDRDREFSGNMASYMGGTNRTYCTPAMLNVSFTDKSTGASENTPRDPCAISNWGNSLHDYSQIEISRHGYIREDAQWSRKSGLSSDLLRWNLAYELWQRGWPMTFTRRPHPLLVNRMGGSTETNWGVGSSSPILQEEGESFCKCLVFAASSHQALILRHHFRDKDERERQVGRQAEVENESILGVQSCGGRVNGGERCSREGIHRVGERVMGMFSGDGAWYDALVVGRREEGDWGEEGGEGGLVYEIEWEDSYSGDKVKSWFELREPPECEKTRLEIPFADDTGDVNRVGIPIYHMYRKGLVHDVNHFLASRTGLADANTVRAQVIEMAVSYVKQLLSHQTVRRAPICVVLVGWERERIDSILGIEQSRKLKDMRVLDLRLDDNVKVSGLQGGGAASFAGIMSQIVLKLQSVIEAVRPEILWVVDDDGIASAAAATCAALMHTMVHFLPSTHTPTRVPANIEMRHGTAQEGKREDTARQEKEEKSEGERGHEGGIEVGLGEQEMRRETKRGARELFAKMLIDTVSAFQSQSQAKGPRGGERCEGGEERLKEDYLIEREHEIDRRERENERRERRNLEREIANERREMEIEKRQKENRFER